MNELQRTLSWALLAAGVAYARKRWNSITVLRAADTAEQGHYTATWEQIWGLQRELGAPPIGLIRSI